MGPVMPFPHPHRRRPDFEGGYNSDSESNEEEAPTTSTTTEAAFESRRHPYRCE